MPKKKINPMTQDQMLNIPYQFDMVPASKAVGPSSSGQTEAQRVGRARSEWEKIAGNPPPDKVPSKEWDEVKKVYKKLEDAEKQQGYKKGGMVRGCGMAARGHGKGRMC